MFITQAQIKPNWSTPKTNNWDIQKTSISVYVVLLLAIKYITMSLKEEFSTISHHVEYISSSSFVKCLCKAITFHSNMILPCIKGHLKSEMSFPHPF